MRKIAVINQKGGSGKTTTVVNLAAYLALAGRSVLLIDMDPQSHASIHLGLEPHAITKSIYDVLIGGTPIADVTISTAVKNLSLVPARIELASAEIELVNTVGREIVLRDAVKKCKQSYDYVLLDCPPSLGLLTLNALTTAREVFIPIQTEFFALEGLTKLFQTIKIVRERINGDIKITGVILTMFDGRKNICNDVAEKVRAHFKEKVFKTKIRDTVRLAEAPSYGKAISEYAPHSHGGEDYRKLTREILRQER